MLAEQYQEIAKQKCQSIFQLLTILLKKIKKYLYEDHLS